MAISCPAIPISDTLKTKTEGVSALNVACMLKAISILVGRCSNRNGARGSCVSSSDVPKDSLRRHEDLCQGCWRQLERLHGTFPLWKEGLGEEEVPRHQAKLFRGTSSS